MIEGKGLTAEEVLHALAERIASGDVQEAMAQAGPTEIEQTISELVELGIVYDTGEEKLGPDGRWHTLWAAVEGT